MAEPRTAGAAAPVAVITGGAGGIGSAVAHRLAADGHRVVIADVNSEHGRAVADRVGGRFIRTDVASPDDNQALIAAVTEDFGRLDVLCLNAGIPAGTAIGPEFDLQRYRHSMHVNLDGVILGVQAALPWLQRGGGAIVATASLAGIAPSADVCYAAAKHAVIGLVRSLAPTLQPHHVTINAVCPGFIDTPLLAPHHTHLIEHGIALAPPTLVADAIAAVLATGTTGQAWEVQAHRPLAPIAFPQITITRTSGDGAADTVLDGR
ncbi:SDR family oxidoreductase (plasmid) [Streptomyces sp. BHT-5-2]|uniref:SDR family NAD(P)-dependent oxidoreductase n=1 Tax=Streptomyces sp. BHT-5-2 TaxID=2866715 RepID=UPI001C8E00A9|nr:SDR family oxidoreductase [Streptomyces sp. BHT-5-2]QZL07281.1 SDR family oxidoreductase [Streptomyces sp. BHT-5-2]